MMNTTTPKACACESCAGATCTVRVPERAEGSASGMPLRRDVRLRTRVHLPALVDARVA